MIDTLWLEHGVEAPARARHWIVQRCREWHCESLADHAALLTSELVTNVFLHARTDCHVRAAFEPPTLTVSVVDRDAQEPSLQVAGSLEESGRGLTIIEALAERWGVERDDAAKSVWFDLSVRA